MMENLKIENQIEIEIFMHMEELSMKENSKIEKKNERVNRLTMVKLNMNEIL